MNSLNVLRSVISKRGSNIRFLSSAARLDLSGVFPPIPTAFKADESVAWDKLEENIEKWNAIPFRGYVVQGSSGEYQYMTADERVEMVKRVKSSSAGGRLIISGSGCESTRDTIDMSKRMSSAGADAVMVVTPCYYRGRMTAEAYIQHYTRVADDSPVPVILYSVPMNTGIDLQTDVILKLSEHPNIIGMKESSGDVTKMGLIVHKTREFQLMAGSAGYLYPALAVGCIGAVSACANVLGREVCELDALFKAGKHSEAAALQRRLIEVNGAVTKVFGIAGMKTAMDWFGFYGGPTRSPLQALTDQELSKLRHIFTTSGFLNN